MTGDPHYLIKTPNPAYNGIRLKVLFRNGVGRTRSAKKARRFDDEFHFTVTPPPGGETWVLAPDREVQRGEEPEREHTVPVVEEFDDDSAGYAVDD